MRKAFQVSMQVLLACALAMALTPLAAARKGRHATDLTQILSDMNAESKKLATVSANLEYTKVTVLVDDKSTESGQLFLRKGKTMEIRINIQKPDQKILLFRKNKGEFYLPKINQIQEYDLEQKSALVQGFLVLGFGSDTNELKKSYSIKYLKEEDLQDDTTVLLELVPRKGNLAAQITKIQMWVSEESWLPLQQKFFESGGDYLIARYSGVKVNRPLPNSTFQLNPASGAKPSR